MKADGALQGEAAICVSRRPRRRRTPRPRRRSTRRRRAPATQQHLRGDAEVVVDEPGAPTQLDRCILAEGRLLGGRLRARRRQSPTSIASRSSTTPCAGSAKSRRAGRARPRDDDASTRERPRERRTASSRGRTVCAARRSTRTRTGAVASPAHRRGAPLARASTRAACTSPRPTSARPEAPRAPHVTVSTRGPDTPDVDASVTLGLGSGVSLSDLRIALARAGERALITVAQVTAGGGDVASTDARIEGLGEPMTATWRCRRRRCACARRREGIDLGRVGPPRPPREEPEGGDRRRSMPTCSCSAKAAQGRAMLDVRRARGGRRQDSARTSTSRSTTGQLVGKVHGEAAGIGIDRSSTRRRWSSAAAARCRSPRGRRRAGHLDFDVHADLAKVAALVPPEDLPVSEARGNVTLKVHLARDDVARPHAGRERLGEHRPARPRREDAEVARHRRRHASTRRRPGASRGSTSPIDAQIDGTNGRRRACRPRLTTRKGALAQLERRLPHFPFGDVLRRIGGPGGATFATTPFDVHLAVPERGLGAVPDMLKQPYVTGKLQADVKATGTVACPTVDLTAASAPLAHRGGRAGAAVSTSTSPPTTTGGSGHGFGEGALRRPGAARPRGAGRGRRRAVSRCRADGARALEGVGARAPRGLSAWSPIAALNDKLVSGQLSGDISLADLHEDAHADVALTIDALNVGSVAYKSAQPAAEGRRPGPRRHLAHRADRRLRGDEGARGRPVGRGDGSGARSARSPSTPRSRRRTSASRRSCPSSARALDELDGRLDANTRVELDPTTRGARSPGRSRSTGARSRRSPAAASFTTSRRT